MTVIAIYSDDGQQPFAAVVGTGDAETCTRHMISVSHFAPLEFVPVGDVQGRDFAYIAQARRRQLEAVGAKFKLPIA